MVKCDLDEYPWWRKLGVYRLFLSGSSSLLESKPLGNRDLLKQLIIPYLVTMFEEDHETPRFRPSQLG